MNYTQRRTFQCSVKKQQMIETSSYFNGEYKHYIFQFFGILLFSSDNLDLFCFFGVSEESNNLL